MSGIPPVSRILTQRKRNSPQREGLEGPDRGWENVRVRVAMCVGGKAKEIR